MKPWMIEGVVGVTKSPQTFYVGRTVDSSSTLNTRVRTLLGERKTKLDDQRTLKGKIRGVRRTLPSPSFIDQPTTSTNSKSPFIPHRHVSHLRLRPTNSVGIRRVCASPGRRPSLLCHPSNGANVYDVFNDPGSDTKKSTRRYIRRAFMKGVWTVPWNRSTVRSTLASARAHRFLRNVQTSVFSFTLLHFGSWGVD